MKDKTRNRNRLAFLRKASKLTQEEVAKLIGVDVTTVCRHESGERTMSAKEIESYANVYKCTPTELFIG